MIEHRVITIIVIVMRAHHAILSLWFDAFYASLTIAVWRYVSYFINLKSISILRPRLHLIDPKKLVSTFEKSSISGLFTVKHDGVVIGGHPSIGH